MKPFLCLLVLLSCFGCKNENRPRQEMLGSVATLKDAVQTGTSLENFRKYRAEVFAAYEAHAKEFPQLQLAMDGLKKDCAAVESVWQTAPDAARSEETLSVQREEALTKVRDDCAAILETLRR